ncbi:DUF4920 domain-containing protein [Parapedobacter sp. 10938]|uniref:DUF4920 domain-containing protein n=1 Tax=Parapedobacter flavus TaxID=3110225 RepID=UPI002DB89D69|nr:DUF4920 domain-containing protein [Parapedobacter sp. 10938]MEC3879231.1 DUF4920 domain-containing protein [Parapedobacter sp. 10938]
MKKIAFTFVALCCFIATSMAQNEIPAAQPGVQYGKAITKNGAINVQQLEAKLTNDSTYTGKVEGKVVEVCKKKGCFIRVLREGEGDPILVRFKDYGFFMPQDIVGKTIVLEGQAKVREVSVAQQRHFAEDAGKDSGEIAKITEPKIDINIIADGVMVVR